MKSKKGVTLVELICTIAIASIIAVIVIAIIPRISDGYVETASVSKAKSAVISLQKLIESEIRTADEVEIAESKNRTIQEKEYCMHDNANGVITVTDKSAATVYFTGNLNGDKALYNGLWYNVSFAKDGSAVDITISVKQSKDGEEIYNSTSTIKPLNTVVKGADSGNALYYKRSA